MTIQFKIQIRDVKKPPVWRRIVIPGNFTFHDLHYTIQTAFGWWGEHLYQFQRHPFDGGWDINQKSWPAIYEWQTYQSYGLHRRHRYHHADYR